MEAFTLSCSKAILMRRVWRWNGHVTRQEALIAKTQEGKPQDHMAADGGEGNQGDGEDLRRHQVYGEGPQMWREHVA